MHSSLEYLKSFALFPIALRRFLRPGLTVDQARAVVQRRLERRNANFLRVVNRSIYGFPNSPYLPLLRLAGCQFGDLENMVRRDGLESTLTRLRQEGVYVTFEELKGRLPIVRHGQTFQTSGRDFDNPCARRDFTLQTGGSTGVANSVYQDLDHIAAGAPQQMLMLDAWGVLNTPVLHWMHILPGGGLRFILQRSYFHRYPEHWFATAPWTDSAYWLKYGAATLYMISCMRALGIKVEVPRSVTMDQAVVVAEAMRKILDGGQGCLLYSSVSRSLRVAVAAAENGIDLRGATFRVGGEPITDAKAHAIRRAGTRLIPAYGAIETGSIGLACASPAASDDVHFCKDSFALITYPHAVARDTTVPAFLLTSLLETSPKVMLNYQSDDYGEVTERDCGCPLGTLGYTTHLHSIRSYSKLVGEAVTLIGNDIVHILEDRLPARFGGTPLDYQLMEEEDSSGFTRLYLLVHPRLVIPVESEVVDYLLRELENSSPMGDAAGRVWRRSGTIQIKRAEPVYTSRGKLMPLHLPQRR